jgi:outer membrane protein TolC
VLGVEVPLDVFGKVRAESQGQRAAARALDASASEAALELRLRVTEAYTRSALAQRAQGVTEAALNGARAREADIQARVSQGAALTADLLRARARRRQREADLAERGADLAGALAALVRTLGAPPGARYQPQDEPAAPAPLDADDASWPAKGLGQRPGLKAVAERLESTRWAIRGERRSKLPDLAAYGQLQDDRNQLSAGHRSTTAGVMLRWNAFDPARGKRLAAAEGDRRAAELDLRAAQDQVRMEVETALRRAQAARDRYAAAVGGAEEGREALRVVQERRQAGMATLTDELETEAASLAAALEEVRAAAEAAIADAALKRAAGEL